MNVHSGIVEGAREDGGHARERRRVLARVSGNQAQGRLSWLTVEVPGWAGAAAGQFALLQAEPSCRFLPRALSVAGEKGNSISFLVDPVGDGTRELCRLRPGDRVSVLGPLGRGFDLGEILGGPGSPGPDLVESVPGRSSRLVLVAGGVGVAPFPLFLSRVGEYGATAALPPDVIALAGFRDASQACAVAPLEGAVAGYAESGRACRLVVSTEDGSLGRPGKVTDLLREELRPDDRVAVCGPTGMSEAVWQVCSLVEGIRVWLSLEAGMACGVGSCHGCVITLSDGSFARVCHEGPVFPGEMIFAPSAEKLDLRQEPV